MKKLKIKLEYSFEVPDDTKIIEHDWEGLFIVNEKIGLKSRADIQGMKLEFEKFDEHGMLEQSSMGSDDCELIDFLYNNGELVKEKTTIQLGNEKYQYTI
jgi:hypothetical protein